MSTLSIDDVQLDEGNSGTTAFVFTVTRSGDTSGTSSVDFATADGTASSPSDYATASGTVNFLATETSQTITVLVEGDTTFEPNETFAVTLSGEVGATISDGSGLGTIVDDDGPADPTMHVGDLNASGSPLSKGKWDASVTIAVHNDSDNPLANATVNVETWTALHAKVRSIDFTAARYR